MNKRTEVISIFIFLILTFNFKYSLADTVSWTKFTPTTHPQARYWHSMTYDTHRSKAILYGGTDTSSFFTDMWEWDGTLKTWTQVFPKTTNPGTVEGATMVYDEKNRQIMLFGGRNSSWHWRENTWIWDGVDWKGLLLPARPAGRMGHSMVYDSKRGEVVIYGGINSGSESNTWTWNGQAKTWAYTQVSSAPSNIYYGHAMVYDSDRDKIVLFGGGRLDTNNDCDAKTAFTTYEFDPATSKWTSIYIPYPNPEPQGRCFHSMYYDKDRKRVVIFGGYDKYQQALSDTWEYDGKTQTWYERKPLTTPSPRETFNSMVYDTKLKHGVLWGVSAWDNKSSQRVFFSDTWAYHATKQASYSYIGSSGTRLNPNNNPSKIHIEAHEYPWADGTDPFKVSFYDLPAKQTFVTFIGFQQANIPLYGIGSTANSFAYTIPVLILPGIHDSDTTGYTDIPIPTNPYLSGLKFYVQAIAFEENSTLFTTTNALEATIEPK